MSRINTALKIAVVFLVVAVIIKLATLPPKSFISEPNDEYDYVVVGGGSAGCVLAARLSEHFRVLLVEAGDHFGYLASVPLAAPFLQQTDNDWQYKTLSQINSSWGLVENVPFWPRGKGLGGSGQLNYLLHYPGKKEDWDSWIAQGADGWSSTIMAHYMAKLIGTRYRDEDFEVTHQLCPAMSAVSCSSTHCKLNSSRIFDDFSTFSSSLDRSTLKSSITRTVRQDKPKVVLLKEDSKSNHLLNALIGSSQELRHLRLSVTPGASTVHYGRRWTSLQSHLLPATNRDTLHVLLPAQATRINFSKKRDSLPTVESVELINRGVKRIVRVKNELILSCGSVASPHLLQLSGIGPRKLLENKGVEVIADLPVGSNLHDHLNVPLYVSLTEPVSLTLSKVLRIGPALKYLLRGKGVYAANGVAGTVSSPADGGILLFGMGSTEEKLLRVVANYKYGVFSAVFPDHKNHSAEGFVFLATCLKPRSRGWIRLQKNDAKVSPIIHPNYLNDPFDITCTRKAIRLAKRLTMTEPFKRLGAQMHLPVLDECLDFEPNINDNEYLECLIRTVGITGYHPAGTVSMGNQTHSVVDNAFRVHKISKLRVVDASVFPSPLSGTPHSILLAMAERAANMIIAEAMP